MPHITEQMLLSFQDEFEKQAFSLGGLWGAARGAGRYLSRQATTAGSGAALGGLGGAGLGAAAGGTRGYLKAREEGAEGGEAARAALGGALKGGVTGAAVGAGLGGAAGLAGAGRARQLVGQLRKSKGTLGGISRFGERQMHGLTGALPEGMNQAQAMKALEMGSVAKKKALEAATREAASFRGIGPEGMKAPGVRGLAEKASKKEEYARKAFEHQKELERLKATSVPGFFKALATKPGQTLRAGLGESWYGAGTGPMGWGMRGVTFGLPAVGVGQALAGPEEGPEGAGRAQRVGQALGGLTFGLTGGLPLLGQMAVTGLGSKTLETMGRGADVARGKAGRGVGFKPKDWKTGRSQFLPEGLGPELEQADISTAGLQRVGRGEE